MNCIFVHGLGQQASSWENTLNYIDKNIKIHCPDIFKLCTNDLSYDNLFNAFSEYCDAYSEPLNICGLSLGGILTLNYTINNPHKVQSLILIGTQYIIPTGLMILQNFIFNLLPQKFFNKIGIPKQKVISLTKSMFYLNFEKELDTITCPVLILCGKRDKANINAAKQLQNRLYDSRLKIIPNAGYEVNKDNPRLLSNEINDFYLSLYNSYN